MGSHFVKLTVSAKLFTLFTFTAYCIRVSVPTVGSCGTGSAVTMGNFGKVMVLMVKGRHTCLPCLCFVTSLRT